MSNTLKAPEFELDDKTASNFISWFKNLPKDDKILRVFDRKGYFSIHGVDAETVAQTCYKGTGVLKHLGKAGNTLASVTLNKSLFEQVLRGALVEQADRVVELYEGHGATWTLTKQGSPGRLADFETEVYSGADVIDTPIVMAATCAVVEGIKTVGVAFIDVASRSIGVSEFTDDEQLCAFERVLVQLGARECAMPQDSTTSKLDNEKMEKVLEGCDVMVCRKPRSLFNGKDVSDAVAPLLVSGGMQHHEDVLERPLACAALAAVVSFSEATANVANHGKFKLALYNSEQYMRLDMAAQRALHVFPVRKDSSATTSVYGLLNRSRSAMGKRLLRSWLKQPLTDADLIAARHDVVAAFHSDVEMRENIRDGHLRGLPDLQRLTRKLAQKTISLQELCQLYMASNRLPVIAEALSSHTGPAAALLTQLYVEPLLEAHGEDALVKFEELLEAAIDLEAVPDEYLIDSSYDASLTDTKKCRDQAVEAIQSDAQSIADDLGLELDKTLKLEWHKSNNVSIRCMRITSKEEKACRGKLTAKYIVLETRKDGTKFTSKNLKAHALELNVLSKQYDELQRSLVQSVVDVAFTFVAVWEAVSEKLAEIDVLAGFADLAACSSAPYVRPEMLGAEHGVLVLEGSRHPCLEVQDHVEFIPNDCRMQRGESWFHVITGPNMGGKSTFIRQVGSFVPCDSARISIRDCIFARVGAGDSQQRGMSTFMAEMLETAAILKGATDKSLLIIDELGRGTSTYDGFGLAWALSEHIMQVIGAPTLFATHFHELTAITGDVGVQNRHMATSLDVASGKLTMLYRVTEGACDQSFGIHVAEFASFPPEVVRRAKEKLKVLEASSAQYSTHAAGQVAVGSKRPREEPCSELTERASALIKEFLHNFAALPGKQLDDEAFKHEVVLLRDRLRAAAATNNALASMLAQCQQAQPDVLMEAVH